MCKDDLNFNTGKQNSLYDYVFYSEEVETSEQKMPNTSKELLIYIIYIPHPNFTINNWSLNKSLEDHQQS